MSRHAQSDTVILYRNCNPEAHKNVKELQHDTLLEICSIFEEYNGIVVAYQY